MVIEATYGWYWAVDLLQELGAVVHLANPRALNWGDRRVKNDVNDATDLADMLRLNRLAEAWIAPPALRELRELVRYRAKLVQLRSGLKAQVHAVMAKEGALPAVSDMFGPAGTRQLDRLELAAPFARRVRSLRELIAVYDREITGLERDIHQHLKGHRGYQAVQAINGIGRVSAAVLVAEIGDVSRFPTAAHLCSWVGLTPKHRESDLKTRRGRISKQGSRLVRATLIEGISRYHGGPHLAAQYHQTRQTARPQQGPRRVGTQGPHARLLRLTRRRDPMPRASRRRVRLGHDQAASSTIGMTPNNEAVEELIEPNLAVANDPIMRTTSANTCLGSRACPPHRTRTRETPDGNTATDGNPENQPNNNNPHRLTRGPRHLDTAPLLHTCRSVLDLRERDRAIIGRAM